MPIVTGSVSIRAPLGICYQAISEPLLWPSFNPFCRAVEILSQEGNMTTFVFRHVSGDQWYSSQFASAEGHFCFVERLHATAPIDCLQFVRTLRSASQESTLLAEDVHVEVSSSGGQSEDDVVERVRSHMGITHQHIKEYLERYANQSV